MTLIRDDLANEDRIIIGIFLGKLKMKMIHSTKDWNQNLVTYTRERPYFNGKFPKTKRIFFHNSIRPSSVSELII